MKRLLVDRQASQEIDDAVDWYETQREGLGFRFLDILDQTLQLVADHPESYSRLRLGPASLVLRRALLHRFPYAVVFLVLENQVRVLAVAQSKAAPRILVRQDFRVIRSAREARSARTECPSGPHFLRRCSL